MALTVYSLGYWGWGNATRELVQSIDAVERHRGYHPPLFVDIRIHRTVRAKGFAGDAFERTVGKRRHRWMPELGNLSVLPAHRSPRIRIQTPSAAADLLQLAKDNARSKRHVIFFCSCPFPRWCHRHTVAQLLLKQARRRNTGLTITEWPGGEPSRVPISAAIDPRATSGATRLALISTRPLWRLAGAPTGTLVEFQGEIVPVGPVRYSSSGWFLPVLTNSYNVPVDGSKSTVAIWRRSVGHKDSVAKAK